MQKQSLGCPDRRYPLRFVLLSEPPRPHSAPFPYRKPVESNPTAVKADFIAADDETCKPSVFARAKLGRSLLDSRLKLPAVLI